MIPLATTTLAVTTRAASPTVDTRDAGSHTGTVTATGIRAHFSTLAGSEATGGGSEQVITFRLVCDPVALTHYDLVTDEQDGSRYEVVWARRRNALGLDHVQAEVRLVLGEGPQ